MRNYSVILARTVLFEKTLESPLDCKEIKPVNPKGNQPWIFIGKTDAEAETPVIWPLDEKSHSLGKTLVLGKIEHKRRRGQERMRWLDSITKSRYVNASKLWKTVEDRGAWHAAVHGVTKSQTRLSDWTATTTLARSIVLLSLFKNCSESTDGCQVNKEGTVGALYYLN